MSERQADDAAPDPGDTAATPSTALVAVPIDQTVVATPIAAPIAEPVPAADTGPRWPAPSTRSTGTHHAYPPPYPPPWAPEHTSGANGSGDADDARATPEGVTVATRPSMAVIAACLGVGVALFALGVLLLTIVA